MTTYRRRSEVSQPPADRSGNLYYLRLDTPMGIMYKVGFTTLDSAEERLAFQGKGHEQYIDSVLCFANLNDAWDVEQKLHNHFKKKALFCGWDEAMPLFQNGQSELYREDILGMDPYYTEEQSEKTRLNIAAANYKSFGATDDECRLLIENGEEKYKNSWGARYRAEASNPAAQPTFAIRSLGFVLKPIISLFLFCATNVLRLFLSNDKASEERITALLERVRNADDERRVRDADDEQRYKAITARRKEWTKLKAELNREMGLNLE